MRGELASQPDNDTHDERRARTPPIMNPLMAVMEYLMVGGGAPFYTRIVIQLDVC